MIRTPTLRSERLTLRPLAPDDMPAVRTLAGDRRVAEMTLLPHPFEGAAADEWLRTRMEGAREGRSETFSVMLQEDGPTLIGHAGLVLDRANEKAELHYWIGVPFWGNGYATEAAQELLRHAFENLRVKRVHADHFARNPASGRVLQKIGMKQEGFLERTSRGGDASRTWWFTESWSKNGPKNTPEGVRPTCVHSSATPCGVRLHQMRSRPALQRPRQRSVSGAFERLQQGLSSALTITASAASSASARNSAS